MQNRVEYNNLSKELKEEFEWHKPLQPDEKVTFVALGGRSTGKRTYPSGRTEPVPIYKASVRVPSTDVIFDPFKDNGLGMQPGGNVDIGVPTMWDSQANRWLFEELEFTKGNKNTMTISGREPHKRFIIDYLRTSNYNRSNPKAIPPAGVGFLFEEVKTFARAKDVIKNEKEKASAKKIIFDMTNAEVSAQMVTLNLASKATTEENQLELLQYIDNPVNLKKFLGQASDTRTPVRFVIQKAVDLELIAYEPVSKQWSYSGTQGNKNICQCTPGADPYEHLMTYFFHNKHGEAHKDHLEAIINKMEADKNLEYVVEKNKDFKTESKDTKFKKKEVPGEISNAT